MLLTTEARQKPIEVRSRAELELALSTLGADGNAYAALGPSDGTFVQAARTGKDRFLVERRDGAPERHFRARRESFSRAEVVALFASVLAGDDAWRTANEWDPLDAGFHRARGAPARPGSGARRSAAGWVFAFVSAALVAFAAWDGGRTAAFVSHAQRTTGAVVGNAPSSSRKAYFPVVKFELFGRPVMFQDRVGSAAQRPIGERVPVLFDPVNPSAARIDSAGSLWLLSAMLGGMGAIFGLVAVRILTSRRRR